MPRLPVVPGREVLRLLLRYGCELKSVRGSHHNLLNPGTNMSSTVPIHGNRDLDRAFFADILSQLGIDVGDFLDFMKNN